MAKNTNVNDNVNKTEGNENVNTNVNNNVIKTVEKKVMITIPGDPLNKNDAFVPVAINGYIWKIKRGEKVSVPEEVARILKEAGYIV